MRDNLRRAAAVAGAMFLLTACGNQGEDVVGVPEYQYDESVNTAVIDAAQGGGAVLLRDVTSLEWDEVALFSEGATLDEIEELVGPSGLQGKRFTSTTNLLVFRLDGEPVALRGTSADVFAGEYGELLGADAVIAPVEGRSGLVVLRDEG
ncbi:hypothetical protein [Isoptericola croceus]|uniref:hypothetical protein n=1 Tax=Isoptericola croceus TaxID=3031406 RepID=UPI0023F6B2EC|nr:hypothetical protein [Isoptericola croceus]